jgi:tetratricopeptide (TPR) repeat protein
MTSLLDQDRFGLPIHLARQDSAAAVDGFIEGFLGYQPSILDVLPAAKHDESVIVQAYAAALRLFSEAPGGPEAARAHLQRARAAALPASEREHRFAEAIALWATGEARAAITTLETIVQRYPRDLTSAKLGQYLAFNLGDSPTMLRLALHARPAAGDVAWLHGLLAFAFEQCHLLEAAERSARDALALQPAEPWAQHALAHVMLTDGRLHEGAALLQSCSDGWQGLTSFMRTHNWWHLAVFQLELGDADAALRLFDNEVWGVDKAYSQDQVGAVSLLARLELADVDVGDRWQELGAWLAGRVADQVQPFLDLQYLYGLARAGRPEAQRLLANIESFAPQAPSDSRRAWQQVAVPAGRGLLAHAQGRWPLAAEQLAQALPRLVSIGGSHAQRDLFEQIWIDALERSSELSGVQNLLRPKADAQPQSMRLARRLRRVEAGLGLPVRTEPGDQR